MAKESEKIASADVKITPTPLHGHDMPNVGDTVNYLAPGGKIHKVKVLSVPDGHDGRLIVADVPVQKSKPNEGGKTSTVETVFEKATVPYRCKELQGGKTWHFA
jgi:hypothetical protein